jgi:hypothetical protein
MLQTIRKNVEMLLEVMEKHLANPQFEGHEELEEFYRRAIDCEENQLPDDKSSESLMMEFFSILHRFNLIALYPAAVNLGILHMGTSRLEYFDDLARIRDLTSDEIDERSRAITTLEFVKAEFEKNLETGRSEYLASE